MFNRIALSHLTEWLDSPSRKPLVIRGARQVGKTQLVRLFCSQAKRELIEINLEEMQISEFEKTASFDIERALSEIHAFTGKKVTGQTVLFIDEIQESRMAYSRLRFFWEKRPDIPVIAAGSLLEVELNRSRQSAPVGRLEFLFLGPMTFEEFLLANGQAVLRDQIKTLNFRAGNTLSESVHNRIIEYLKDYFYVGGMPEAVKVFVEGRRDLPAARKVQQEILESYRQDVRKYAEGKVASVILDVFDHMAYEVGNKVKFINFSTEKSSYVKEALNKLDDIYILQKVYHSPCSGLPLKKGESTDVYKIFLLDVGLYNCLMEISWPDMVRLDARELLNKGEMAEQFIAQHLYLGAFKTQRPRLNYWLREKVPGNAELDFVIAREGALVPVEVKAGKSGSIKSLSRFMYEKQNIVDTAIRLDLAYRENFVENVSFKIGTKDKTDSIRFKLINQPLYSV